MATLRASVALGRPATARLVASITPGMESPVYGPYAAGVVATDDVGFRLYSALAQLTVDGLLPGTLYYLAVEVEGRLLAYPRGRARTAVEGAQSFSCAFSSCEESGSNHVVFDAIRVMAEDRPLQFFMHLGDHGYGDHSESDPAYYLSNWSGQMRLPAQALFHRSLRVPYVPDDHDSDKQGHFTIDDDPDRPTRLALMSALAKRVPLNPGIPIEQGMCSSWQEGRVLFVATDARTMRNIETNPDGTGKSMLGDDQKQWLKDRLDYAGANGLACIWFNGSPWYGAADDSWHQYQTERTEIADHIKAAGLVGRIGFVTGDYHVSIIDDGTNTDFATGGGAPLPVFIASPLDKVQATSMGMPSSEGEVFGYKGQFGVMDVVDEGGDEIDITWTAYRTTSDSDPTLVETLSLTWTADLS